MKKVSLQWIALTLMVLPLVACGKKGATAKIQFKNASSTSFYERVSLQQAWFNQLVATPVSVTTFKMKLLAAYLTQDMDSTGGNIGGTSIFYLNEECQDDISHCDITAGDGSRGITHVVNSFFDFSGGPDAANATLSSQGRSIDPATYKYARLEFCKFNDTANVNAKWAVTGETTEHDLSLSSCAVSSEQFETPLTVAAGDSVTVTMSYDLSDTINTTGTGPGCVTIGSDNVCFSMPTFVPSASK